MFRFRRAVKSQLDFLVGEAIDNGIDHDNINQTLRIIVSNQELFDNYAAKIAEQNNQVRAAVAVIISEIGKLQQAAKNEKPIDTTKMDAAIEQLTSAVDEVEAVPTPVEEPTFADPSVPVEVDFRDLTVDPNGE